MKKKSKSGKPNLDFTKRNSLKKKVIVIDGSVIQYLYYQVKIAAHPGSTTDDSMDYIKPVVRKESGFLVTHSGTNDLTNVVNTTKEIRTR